jgi:endonuclease/exonuclease/phosphatase family metal-dependent hydrolase
MRMLGFALAVTALFTALQHAALAEPVELRVLTFNVLVDFSNTPPVPRWERRRDLCLQVVQEANPHLISFQENMPKQLDFFRAGLPGYGVVGELTISNADIEKFKTVLPVAAALGMKRYTDALLFFREDTFELVEQGHWWLCSTPDTPNNDFGNALPRLMVWAKLRHLDSGKELVAVATHFDNSLPSQVHMARLSHELLQPYIDAGLPVIFAGDFNTSPTRGDYAKLTEGDWTDAYIAAPEASENGVDNHVSTVFFGENRIDHILFHGAGFEAVGWKRIESPDPDKPLSDHYPALATLHWSP